MVGMAIAPETTVRFYSYRRMLPPVTPEDVYGNLAVKAYELALNESRKLPGSRILFVPREKGDLAVDLDVTNPNPDVTNPNGGLTVKLSIFTGGDTYYPRFVVRERREWE